MLDTHTLIWWVEGGSELAARIRRVLQKANADRPVYVSDISLRKTAVLFQLGRIRQTIPLPDWIDRATAEPLVRRVGISPAIAAETRALPETFHRDPADGILVATARVLQARLVTMDERITQANVLPVL